MQLVTIELKTENALYSGHKLLSCCYEFLIDGHNIFFVLHTIFVFINSAGLLASLWPRYHVLYFLFFYVL